MTFGGRLGGDGGEDEGSAGGLAVTDVTVAGGMKSAGMMEGAVVGETRLQDTAATEDEGSAGGLAVTEVTVAGGMKGAAAADDTGEGALGAMLAFFFAATESRYCFMFFAGSSLANDLARHPFC